MQRGIIPPPAGVTPDFSGTRTPLQKKIIVAQSAITATSAIFLGLRLYTRAFLNRNLGLDDLLICVSWLGCIAWFVIITYAFQFGFGQHLWNVTPDRLDGYLQILIGIAIIYLWTTALAKISLLVLYHRVSVQTQMKIAIYVLAFFTLGYTLAITGVVLGPCNPNAGRVSTCFKDLNLFMAIINIVTDFLIILLPLPMLHKLQLHRKQKILVGAVFTLGSGVIIVSIVRIIYIYSFIGYADFTYYQASAAILSDIELNVGVICACMATLKPFVTRHMSTLLSFSGHAENSNTRSRGFSRLQRSQGHRTSYGLGTLENGNLKPEHNKQGNGIEVSTQYEVTSERILMDSDSTERIIVPDHR